MHVKICTEAMHSNGTSGNSLFTIYHLPFTLLFRDSRFLLNTHVSQYGHTRYKVTKRLYVKCSYISATTQSLAFLHYHRPDQNKPLS